MCGINGLFCLAGKTLPDGRDLVGKMNRAIRHRGPDDNGSWADEEKGIYLGHQRLSILDLSAKGHQPMRSSAGSAIVYNGEVYNFREIRRDYKDRRFFSNTDTEVILAAYEHKGHACLDNFNGMFAFAIWDSSQNRLFLARDRVGIKPLYYTVQNNVFAFSSEIKALLTLPWVHAELDEEDLYHFLTFNKVFPPKTMFKGIRKFHPGYKMSVGTGGILSHEQYWEVEFSDYGALPEDELQERIRVGLESSVRRRLVSDVPVGAFLSGGVDSSILVSLIKKNTSAPVKTFSVGFESAPDYTELEYARQIASRFNTEHYEKIVRPDDIIDFLPSIVEIFDEPLADATSIPIHFISQLARDNGTIVVLTGDGADELFCGYRNWIRYARLAPVYHFFSSLPKPLKKVFVECHGKIRGEPSTHEILFRALHNQEFFWGGAGAVKESVKDSFLSPSFVRRMKGMNSHDKVFELRKVFEQLGPSSGRRLDHVDWMAFTGLKRIVPNYYLYRADRLGMASSIELRVPFLDHEFVNLALSIPGKFKILNNESKYILKKSFEHVFGKELLYRRKQGFCVPLQEWAGETIVRYIEENLNSFCSDTGLFSESGLREHLAGAQAGSSTHTFGLWNIYFLMSWFYKWLL